MTVHTGSPPAQRRAVVRTVVILGIIAVALYLFTIFGSS